MRTWFLWILIHEAIKLRVWVSLFSPRLSPFSPCTDINSHFCLSSIIGRIEAINWWERWFRDFVECCCWYRPRFEKCDLALPLCGCVNTPATGCPGCPSSTKWNGLYCDWQGALTSKYPVPSGPRDTKAWTFPQHLLIAIYFHLNTKNTSCSSTEIRKKKLSAVAHWTTKLP